MVRAITTSHIASHGGPAPACRIRSTPASTRAYSSSAADSRTVWQAKSRQVAAHVPLRSTGWTPWPRLPEGRTDEHLSKVRVPPVGARMDDVERLIEAFRARSRWSVLSKLDALLDLEQLDDPRIVPFLLHVLADQREPTRRSNVPDPPRRASRYFASCRRTGCSAAPPEVSCRFGASNKGAIS